jgi:tRNA nucleotidyltransferase (CCA-adding enzyme)
MGAPAALARATFPAPILEVLRRLASAGHRSYLVGGAVRDLLLHRARQASDFDVATPATPQEVIALFPKVIPTGIAHGTVTVLLRGEKIEVTTFRGEGAYVDGRRPESVTFHRDLEADLARRDFTMNAMAYDPLEGHFADPFGGQADMARRRVRAVGDPAARFAEDGLRALRAARFVAQLDYGLDTATRRAIPGALDVARKVSVERIAEELSKLVVAPHAARGVLLLGRTGLLSVALPAVAAHPKRARDHLVRVLSATHPEPTRRFAALLHGVTFEQAEALLLGLRLPRRLVDEVTALLRAHSCLAGGEATTWPRDPRESRRWLAGVGAGRAEALLDLAEAEVKALPAARRERLAAELKDLKARVTEVLAASPPLTLAQLALDGRAVMTLLGAGPGPHVGEALRHLLDRVLDDPAENTRERLEALLRRWWERQARLL